MKKLLFIFSFLFCALISMAQLPSFPNNNLNNSNTATLFGYQGGLTSNGYKLKQFSDTASANAALYLKFTPHIMIKVGNNVYVRNTAATQWILVGGNFILNPGVDSVTLYGNNLCQWVGGSSTCYALNNSSFSNYSIRGDFIYDSLLYFHNTPYQYYILGRYFTAPYTSHLLTPPNPSAARNDVAYVDTLSSASIITGVNGGGVPATNPVSQFKIGEIHINAADTVPSNFSNVIAYRNNLEWIASSSISGFNNAYATAPFAGTSTSMYVPSFVNGETISLLRDTLLNISNASYLKVFVWLNASFSAANLNFSFNNLGNAATTSVPLLNGQFGYTSTIVGSWQEVNIPMAYFQLFSNSIDEIIIGITGANASGFKIGNVVIQFGGLPTSSAIGGIQAVNDNYGPKVYFSVTDTGYVDSDTSNYVYKDKRTNTVLFTLPTSLKNLVSNRTAADTCIVLDTLGRTIFISLNPYCQGAAVDSSKWTLSGSNIYNKNSGNVGINDATPSEKLDVDGSINISSGSAYKYNSVNVIRAQTSLENYYLGNSGNLTATGNYNISLGNGALNSITSGVENIAIGRLAMYYNLTGGLNTVVGSNSLGSNLSNFNSAFGSNSLSANTTGTENTAIGRRSLPRLIDGNGNIGIGIESGGFTTTGDNNIFIGYYAGNRATTQSNQIFINSIYRNNYLGDTSESPIYIRQNATVANQIIKLNGQLHFPLGAGAGKYLQSDASGYTSWQTISSGITTASNGLTLTGSDVTLEGTLTKNTAIATGAFTTTFSTATSAINPFKVTSTTGAAILVNTTTGIGFSAVTSGGTGLNIVNSSGLAIYGKGTNAAAIMQLEAANANSLTLSNLQLYRTTTSTAANDIGQSLDFVMETSDGTSANSNQFISRWSDVTTATRTSKFTLTGVNNAVTSDWLTLDGVYGLLGTDTISTRAYARSVGGGSVVWGGIGGTLSDQTDLNTALGLKAPLASPTFTGTVTIPTPFTLGATSVTSTGTQLNYINAATGTTGTTSTNLVFSTSPTFITPVLGAATATSITHTQTASAANTVVESFIANNTTTASSGNQMFGGFFHSGGQGWKTTATAASQAVDYRHGLVPIQGAANPFANYVFESSVNGSAYTRQLALKSDGQIGLGSSPTLTTDAFYSAIVPNADLSGQLIITSNVTQATVKSLFYGELILSGSGAFSAVRAAGVTVSNNGTNTTNAIRAGAFSSKNNNAGSRANTLIGVDASALTDNSTGGTVAVMSGLDASFYINAAGPIVTTATGVRVKDILVNSGTFTNTFGVWVGDITLGTQTNTPHSFYASDANAYNYFAGNTGIGVTTPTALLNIKASTATASTGQIKLAEGTRQTTAEDGTINYIANNLEFVETSTVYTLAKTLTATATLDFGSTLAGAVTDLTITVTGAADGDAITIGVPNGSYPATGTFTAWISAANTATIRYANNSLTLAQDPASGTFRVSVIKY